jgi:hypothetical protein
MCTEFLNKMKELSINCDKCLDTFLLWKNNTDINNFENMFLLVRCDKCVGLSEKNEHIIVSCTNTSDIYYNNVPVFHADYNKKDRYYYSLRLYVIREIYDSRIDHSDLFEISL